MERRNITHSVKSEMTAFLAMQSGIITEYDDKLTRQLVERITVFEGKLRVDFKSGVEIEVEVEVEI